MYMIGNQVFPSRWEPKCSLLVQIAYDYIHCNAIQLELVHHTIFTIAIKYIKIY
jgi:hypothetical protein